MVGVAVGLGNVWRFPYMMGRYGGSAFLFVYLAFVIAFAVPALMGEWALGRATRRGPLGAFTAALGRPGHGIGLLLLFTILVSTSYYVVVVGNVVYTAAFGAWHGFAAETTDAYGRGLASGPVQTVASWIVLWLALLVMYFGLHRGVERVSKMFVPFFGVVVTYLIVSSLRLPNATHHLVEFLKPDFGALTGTSVFAAMGQAFFSLSLGGTFYLIYGSYLRDDEPIPGSAVLTALGDVGAALLAALFIVPASLAFGLDLAAGPQLIFNTLPQLFADIPGGRGLGTFFLLALTTVSFLSVIAALQVLLGAGVDALGWPRGRSLLVIGGVESLLLLPSTFHPSLIGTLDLIFGSGMQVLGSGLALIALTWGLGRERTLQQIFRRTAGPQPRFYLFWARWVVPAALLVTLGVYLHDIL